MANLLSTTLSGNNHITLGPNATWSSYLRVGGNGYSVSGNEYASVVTTNGNLHLDAGTSRAIYLNHYAGTSGVAFGNGASGVSAWMGADGDLWKGSGDNSGTQYVYNSGTWGISITGNAGSLDGYDYSQFTGVLARYITTANNGTRIRITAPFNTDSGKMFSVDITMYAGYTQYKYTVSAYMYSTTNQWYNPKALFTGDGAPDIYVGRDNSGKAYISIANGAYTGIVVNNLVGGYVASEVDSYSPWVITLDSGNENSVGVSVITTITSNNIGSQSVSYATTAGSITSQANSATITATTSNTANAIVLRDGSGDIYSRYSFSNYVNTTNNDESGITRFIIKNGDDYHRSATTTVAADIIRGVASGSWAINITGSAGSVTNGVYTTQSINNLTGVLNFGVHNATPYNDATGVSNGIAFGGIESSTLRTYGIFTELENIGGNYSKLTLNYHTGIRIGASSSYGGTRFYNNFAGGSGGGSVIFSVGNGDNHVRVLNNLYVTGTVTGSNLSGTNTGDQTNISGNAATATSAGTVTGSSTIGGYLTLATDWGVSPYTAAFNIVGTHPSMVFRGSNGDTHYLIHMDSAGDIQYYFGPGYTTNNWTQRYTFTKGGDFSVRTGNISASGTITGSNLSGTNTGDQTNISGNAATATYATTAGALTSMNISQFTNNSGYITGTYVVANGTSAGDIDADWGQSFKTFDPVPSGTPPLASPNIRTINIGENYARRTQLAFDYASDVAYFRRRNDSGWQTWREFIHSGNIGSQTVATAGNATTVGGLAVHAGRNNEVNKIVRTDANGYIQAGWINTTSGAFSSGINKIYCSDDDYMRYQTPANFISNLGLITTGNIGSQSVSTATNLYGLGTIQSTSTGTSYQNNYQVRENSGGSGNTSEIYAPQLAFHWGGIVASSIMMESSGRIAIRNNPGSSYENFIANIVYASSDMRAPIFYDSQDTTYYLDPNSSVSGIFAGSVGINNTSPVNANWGNASNTKQLSINATDYAVINLLGGSRRFSMGVGDNIFYMCYDNTAGRHNITVSSSGSVSIPVDVRSPIFYDSQDTAYYGDFASTSRMNAIVYDNLYFSGDQTYGFIGRNVYADTINGRGSDPLELNYYDGGSVIIGTGATGSKALYAGSLFSGGSAVITAANIGSQSVSYAASAGGVSWANVSSKPSRWLNTTTLIDNNEPDTITESGFWQSYLGSGNPTGTWFNYVNVRHSNPGNAHGFQLGMSYYDNNLWFRSYSGNVTYLSWSRALGTNTDPYPSNMNQYVRTTDDVTHNSTTSTLFLVNGHSDNTKGYRIHNTSGSSVSAMFTNSSNQLVIAAGAVDQINLNKKVYVNGVALGVNVAPSATAGRIDASNDIVAFSSSDERLKDNITPIENALNKVKSLTGVEFDWKPEHKEAHGHEGRDTGIIAQQVLAVMPSAVRTNDTGYLAVRYEKLIGLLIEGMKEQQTQIDELKTKLDGLTK